MLRKTVTTCDRTKRWRRDRVLLLIGFAGALCRSELVALQVEDVALVANGLRIRIQRGKADKQGRGAEIGLPAANMSKPALRKPSKTGSGGQARCWAVVPASVPAVAFSIPRCILMQPAAS